MEKLTDQNKAKNLRPTPEAESDKLTGIANHAVGSFLLPGNVEVLCDELPPPPPPVSPKSVMSKRKIKYWDRMRNSKDPFISSSCVFASNEGKEKKNDNRNIGFTKYNMTKAGNSKKADDDEDDEFDWASHNTETNIAFNSEHTIQCIRGQISDNEDDYGYESNCNPKSVSTGMANQILPPPLKQSITSSASMIDEPKSIAPKSRVTRSLATAESVLPKQPFYRESQKSILPNPSSSRNESHDMHASNLMHTQSIIDAYTNSKRDIPLWEHSKFCLICSTAAHNTVNCPEPPPAKVMLIRAKRLCMKCLSPAHSASACHRVDGIQCTDCGQSHLVYVHHRPRGWLNITAPTPAKPLSGETLSTIAPEPSRSVHHQNRAASCTGASIFTGDRDDNGQDNRTIFSYSGDDNITLISRPDSHFLWSSSSARLGNRNRHDRTTSSSVIGDFDRSSARDRTSVSNTVHPQDKPLIDFD